MTGAVDARLFADAVAAYDAVGGEEIPTDDHLRRWTKTREDPQQFIVPDDPLVERYAEAIDPHTDGFELNGLQDFEYVANAEQCDELFCWDYPQDTLDRGSGNCVDYAIAAASLLEAAEVEARVVIGNVYWEGNCDSDVPVEDCDPGLHAVAEARIDGDRYISDTATIGEAVPRSVYDDYVQEWVPLTMFGEDLPYQVYDPGR